jgi:hypothetical protein
VKLSEEIEKKKAMVREIRQAREAGDKLLCDVRRETYEHNT